MYSSFKENIWGDDLADMQFIGKYDKGFWFFLCVIGFFNKYAWVIIYKDKKGITNFNVLQKIPNSSNLKPDKIWIDNRCSEFHKRSNKSWLQDNNVFNTI